MANGYTEYTEEFPTTASSQEELKRLASDIQSGGNIPLERLGEVMDSLNAIYDPYYMFLDEEEWAAKYGEKGPGARVLPEYTRDDPNRAFVDTVVMRKPTEIYGYHGLLENIGDEFGHIIQFSELEDEESRSAYDRRKQAETGYAYERANYPIEDLDREAVLETFKTFGESEDMANFLYESITGDISNNPRERQIYLNHAIEYMNQNPSLYSSIQYWKPGFIEHQAHHDPDYAPAISALLNEATKIDFDRYRRNLGK